MTVPDGWRGSPCGYVMIEFSLEQPRGGVQFVILPGSSPEAMVGQRVCERELSEYVCEGEGRGAVCHPARKLPGGYGG